jgi:hypothetical protein
MKLKLPMQVLRAKHAQALGMFSRPASVAAPLQPKDARQPRRQRSMKREAQNKRF